MEDDPKYYEDDAERCEILLVPGYTYMMIAKIESEGDMDMQYMDVSVPQHAIGELSMIDDGRIFLDGIEIMALDTPTGPITLKALLVEC